MQIVQSGHLPLHPQLGRRHCLGPERNLLTIVLVEGDMNLCSANIVLCFSQGELGLQTLLIILRREEVSDMLGVQALYFIPIQVLNSILLQIFYSKGCMLKSETDGPVLYFSSFRISYAAQPMDRSPPGSSVLGIARQEHWSGVPFPSPGNLPHPGIKPVSLVSPAFAGRFFTTAPPGKPGSSYK